MLVRYEYFGRYTLILKDCILGWPVYIFMNYLFCIKVVPLNNLAYIRNCPSLHGTVGLTSLRVIVLTSFFKFSLIFMNTRYANEIP